MNKDYTDARRYYRMSAERGDAIAMYYYAMMCENGDGGDRNRIEAAIWARQAKAAGCKTDGVDELIARTVSLLPIGN